MLRLKLLPETLGASVPLEFWLANKDELLARGGTTAVQIAADQSPVDLADDLDKIDCIVLPLVAGVDGQALFSRLSPYVLS